MDDSELDKADKKTEEKNQAGDNNSENEAIQADFGKEFEDFINHIGSLSLTLRPSLSAISASLKNTVKEYEEFNQKYVQKEGVDEHKAVLTRPDKFQEFKDLSRQLNSHVLALKIIPRSYIISLVSQYDAYVGNLIKLVFLCKPELMNASEKNLSFSNLVEFSTMDDAKEFILDKEIEGLLRKSHSDQFRWMESKLKIPLRDNLDVWSQFIELTERRNLFVHTGGIVSSQYLKVCTENMVDVSDRSKGDELMVSVKYFEQSYNAIFEIGFKLGQVLWRKFSPDDLKFADLQLNMTGFDRLYAEDYELTQMIFDFGTQTLKTHAEESSRRVMVVNRALAHKWRGDNDSAVAIIAEEDWSATASKFKLAECVIQDNFDEAYVMMLKIGDNEDEIAKDNYRMWPVFKAIREEKRFQEIFEEIYKEPFALVEEEELIISDELSNDEN